MMYTPTVHPNRPLTMGDVIEFSRVPPASYMQIRRPYMVVGIHKNTVHFRSPLTGGGTYERRDDVALSRYRIISRSMDSADEIAALFAKAVTS